MTINRANTFGWATHEKLTSVQQNQVDLNTTYALDKRSGQTDSLASIVTVLNGASFVMASGSLINFQSGSLLNISSGASLTLATGAVVTANANISFNGTNTVNSTGSFNFTSGSTFSTASGSNFTLAAGTVTTISSTVNFTATSNFGIFSTANFYGVLNTVAGTSVANFNNIVNFGSSSVTTFNGPATISATSSLTFDGNSYHIGTSTDTFLSGTSLILNPGSQLANGGTTALLGTVNITGATALNAVTTVNASLICNSTADLNGITTVAGSSTFTGTLTATTSAVTMANFTLTGANKVKLISRSYNRKIGAIMERAIPTNWDSVVGAGGIFETNSTVGAQGFFPIRLPSGAIISSIRLYLNPAGSGSHVNLPANMPSISLISVSGGASSTVASQIDTSASVAAYDTFHAIQLSGLGYTVNNTNESLHLALITESGTNSVSDCQVWDAEVTFSVTSIDDGFIV